MLGKRKEQRSILIVGGFNKARSLANSLLKKGYRVTVINKEYDACEKLAEIKGISYEECAHITMENGKRFFRIP